MATLSPPNLSGHCHSPYSYLALSLFLCFGCLPVSLPPLISIAIFRFLPLSLLLRSIRIPNFFHPNPRIHFEATSANTNKPGGEWVKCKGRKKIQRII
ncbi:hypothetical protein IE53DRAFT_388532 [Violaceomyces palustris]|uniref:Uncharacterized protein n=1 Tax=Violaceomyces palustris TaxID=1673888 RepID=A0ACD0NU09_9BASI|nr:hypothetical protein IE53DRAFT_388532 [Violaceomyces palustris]